MGHPVCCLDDELCDVERCRYHIDAFWLGNCVLRANRSHEFEEIGMALGVSKQRACQVVQSALENYKRHLTRSQRV